jgi:hypothetical protein
MEQRFDIEHNITPPMRKAITLVHSSGLVVYVAQATFGPKGEDQNESILQDVARRIADVLEK